MFFIAGWGTRRKAVSEGMFHCPVCNSEESYTRFAERKWFSVFFIPLFPLSAPHEYVNCWKCGTPLGPERVGLAQQAAPLSTVSSAAVAGLVFSVLSLLTICVFFFAIPLALVALILGHIGLSNVRKGEPRVSGGWQAITALSISYPVLLLSTAIAVWFFMPRSGSQDNGRGGAFYQSSVDTAELKNNPVERLREAEYAVATKGNQSAGRGNSSEARLVAELFANRLKELREIAFTEGKKSLFSASQGEFITYCELHADRCLFVVHVPSYRDYKSDAKELLSSIAWRVAQDTVKGKLNRGDSLAVALRGTILYGDILKGTVGSEGAGKDTFVLVDKDELYSFFPSSDGSASDESTRADHPAVVSAENDADSQVVSGVTGRNPGEVVVNNGRARDGQGKEENPLLARDHVFGEVVGGDDNKDLVTESVIKSIPKSMQSRAVEGKPSVVAEDKKEPSFVNRIAVEKLLTIENTMWAFQSLAFSEDGKWLVAGKMDNVIVLFDAETGGMLDKVEDLRDLGQIQQVAISADRNRVVAGGYSGVTRAFEISPEGKFGVPTDLYRHGKEVTNLQVSKKHGFVISGSRDGTIAWQPMDNRSNQVRLCQELKDDVLAIGLPENGTDAWATDGNAVVKFSLRDSSVVEKLGQKNQAWQAAAFSPDGKRLVFGGYSDLKMITLGSPAAERSIKLESGEAIHSLLFHPNGKWVIAGVRGKVVIWDFEAGEKIAEQTCDTIQHIASLALSADGALLAATANSAQQDIVVFRLGDEL